MKRLSFNLEMARAFQEGRKTRTWRLMKKQPESAEILDVGDSIFVFDETEHAARQSVITYKLPAARSFYIIKKPYLPREVVFIGEPWAPVGDIARKAIETAKKWPYGLVSLPEYKGPEFIYKVDWDAQGKQYINKWKSPSVMPEWASRAKVRILSCVPQMVQDINKKRHDEVLREGWPFQGIDTGSPYKDFGLYIESIYPGAWEKNLWGWAVEFEE